jgi:hypothetical protein
VRGASPRAAASERDLDAEPRNDRVVPPTRRLRRSCRRNPCAEFGPCSVPPSSPSQPHCSAPRTGHEGSEERCQEGLAEHGGAESGSARSADDRPPREARSRSSEGVAPPAQPPIKRTPAQRTAGDGDWSRFIAGDYRGRMIRRRGDSREDDVAGLQCCERAGLAHRGPPKSLIGRIDVWLRAHHPMQKQLAIPAEGAVH